MNNEMNNEVYPLTVEEYEAEVEISEDVEVE